MKRAKCVWLKRASVETKAVIPTGGFQKAFQIWDLRLGSNQPLGDIALGAGAQIDHLQLA